jgi:hypothetical protein
MKALIIPYRQITVNTIGMINKYFSMVDKIKGVGAPLFLLDPVLFNFEIPQKGNFVLGYNSVVYMRPQNSDVKFCGTF